MVRALPAAERIMRNLTRKKMSWKLGTRRKKFRFLFMGVRSPEF